MRHLNLWTVSMCVHLWHWLGERAGFSFHSSGKGPTEHWPWKWSKHKPQYKCVCVTLYVLQYPPLNSEGGFKHTHKHTHACTLTQTLALALFSRWVVGATNVYDLNQANPTGLFQWTENDLQDAATEPRRERKSEEILGLHFKSLND